MRSITLVLSVLIAGTAMAQITEPPADTVYTDLDVAEFRTAENELWFTAEVGERVVHDGISTSSRTKVEDTITGSRISRKPLGNGWWERVYNTGNVTVQVAYLADGDLRRLMGRTRHDRSNAGRLGEAGNAMSRLQLMQYPSGEQFWLCRIFLPTSARNTSDDLRRSLEHEVFHCLGWQH